MLIRYFAAARAATGVSHETVTAPVGGTVAELLSVLTDRHPALAAVLPRCSYLLDELAVRSPNTPAIGATLDVLPPFSGG